MRKRTNNPVGSLAPAFGRFPFQEAGHGFRLLTDFRSSQKSGRLAEWTGSGDWKVLEEKPFNEVWSAAGFGSPMIATGWDHVSVIMKLYTDGEWKRYRLPKGSHAFGHTSAVEWMRIRSVETERALMNAHGLFYEIAA